MGGGNIEYRFQLKSNHYKYAHVDFRLNGFFENERVDLWVDNLSRICLVLVTKILKNQLFAGYPCLAQELLFEVKSKF